MLIQMGPEVFVLFQAAETEGCIIRQQKQRGEHYK